MGTVPGSLFYPDGVPARTETRLAHPGEAPLRERLGAYAFDIRPCDDKSDNFPCPGHQFSDRFLLQDRGVFHGSHLLSVSFAELYAISSGVYDGDGVDNAFPCPSAGFFREMAEGGSGGDILYTYGNYSALLRPVADVYIFPVLRRMGNDEKVYN